MVFSKIYDFLVLVNVISSCGKIIHLFKWELFPEVENITNLNDDVTNLKSIRVYFRICSSVPSKFNSRGHPRDLGFFLCIVGCMGFAWSPLIGSWTLGSRLRIFIILIM